MAAQPAALSRTLRCLAARGAGRPGATSLSGLLGARRPLAPSPAPPATSGRLSTAPGAATEAEASVAPPAEAAAPPAAAARNGVYQSVAYPFTDIEARWQAHWEEHQTFRTPEFHELDTSKPKFYALDMFPYPRWVLCRWCGLQRRLCGRRAAVGRNSR